MVDNNIYPLFIFFNNMISCIQMLVTINTTKVQVSFVVSLLYPLLVIQGFTWTIYKLNTILLFLIWRSSNAFESKPMVKIILIYDRLNLWRHRQFITILYQFLHIRIEIIHGSHMYILFLPRVGLYVSFLPLANARGKTLWYKGLPVVKTIYTYGFHELFLNYIKYI